MFEDGGQRGIWWELNLEDGRRVPMQDLVGLYPKHSGEPLEGFKLGFLP